MKFFKFILLASIIFVGATLQAQSNSVAVLPFYNYKGTTYTGYDNFPIKIKSLIESYLLKQAKDTVIDISIRELALKELEYSQSGITATAMEIGKQKNANAVIYGWHTIDNNDNFEIHLKRVELITTKITRSKSIKIPLSQLDNSIRYLFEAGRPPKPNSKPKPKPKYKANNTYTGNSRASINYSDWVIGATVGLAFDNPNLFGKTFFNETYTSIAIGLFLANKDDNSIRFAWHPIHVLELQLGVLAERFLANGILHTFRNEEHKKISIHYKNIWFPLYWGMHYKYYSPINQLSVMVSKNYYSSKIEHVDSRAFYAYGIELGLHLLYVNIGLVLEYQSHIDEIKVTVAGSVPIVPIPWFEF